MVKIPPKERKEWAELLTGKLDVKLKNFFFQMKVTDARSKIISKQISLADAIDDIYNLCEKFHKANNMPEDLKQIFNVEFDPDTRNLIL